MVYDFVSVFFVFFSDQVECVLRVGDGEYLGAWTLSEYRCYVCVCVCRRERPGWILEYKFRG